MSYPIFSCDGLRNDDYLSFWFRIFGYGLVVTTAPPLFSDRMGYTKSLRIGRLRIKGLKP